MRTHQVRRDEHLGPVLREVLQRRDRGANARVIRDVQVTIERDVEIAPDEHGLALEVRLGEVPDRLLLHRRARFDDRGAGDLAKGLGAAGGRERGAGEAGVRGERLRHFFISFFVVGVFVCVNV